MLSTTIKEIMSLHFLSQLLAWPPVFLEHSQFFAVVDFLCNYSLIFCITVIKKSCLFKSFFQNTNNASKFEAQTVLIPLKGVSRRQKDQENFFSRER